MKPDAKKEAGAEGGKPKTVKNTALDVQRMKLEKLMKNPDKPVVIPDRQRDKKMPHVPDFVRNVMGSSAGAGSGEFHVYRHLRRKEYARQKAIVERGERNALDDDFQVKLMENKIAADERTAKKRAKRLKKKQQLKKKKIEKAKSGVLMTDPLSESTSSSEEDEGEANDSKMECADDPLPQDDKPADA